jgi:hypothetical protein
MPPRQWRRHRNTGDPMATSKNTFSWEDPFHLSAQLTDDERQV